MIGAGLVLASLFLNENSAPVISNAAAFIWIIFLMLGYCSITTSPSLTFAIGYSTKC
jgi:hypothetical protein